MNIESISNHNFHKLYWIWLNLIHFIEWSTTSYSPPPYSKKRNHTFPTVFKLKFIKKKSICQIYYKMDNNKKILFNVQSMIYTSKNWINWNTNKRVTRWPMNHMGTNNNKTKLWFFCELTKFLQKKNLGFDNTEKSKANFFRSSSIFDFFLTKWKQNKNFVSKLTNRLDFKIGVKKSTDQIVATRSNHKSQIYWYI